MGRKMELKTGDRIRLKIDVVGTQTFEVKTVCPGDFPGILVLELERLDEPPSVSINLEGAGACTHPNSTLIAGDGEGGVYLCAGCGEEFAPWS